MMVSEHFAEETKSTLKWVAAGFAIFSVAYLAKQIYSRFTKKSQTHPQQLQQSRKTQSKQPQNLITHRSQYSEFYFDKELEIQYIQSSMPENPSVEDIYLNSPLIARDQFIKYTREMRKRRRLVRKISQDQYINTILSYENQVQQLLYRSRIQLVESLNMDPETFAHMEQNYQAIEQLRPLHLKSQQILRRKLITDTNQKKMSDEKLVQIIQEQLGFIHNKMYDRLRNKLQKEMQVGQQLILTIIEALIEDIIFQKFGYQVQDVSRKIQQIKFNTKQIDEARKKMQVDISDFNYDSLESVQDPSQIPQLYQSQLIKQLKQSANTLHKSEEESMEEA